MMFVPIQTVAYFLDQSHYLGHARRGIAWSDEHGVIVLASPTSRRLPTDWLEITRWCLVGSSNGGSTQYAKLRRELTATTVVSYSDPSVGHTGALYRACNWLWAPTWHRLRPPPSGHGNWTAGKQESVKDRWVDVLAPDPRRADLLAVKDASVVRAMPWANWQEPVIHHGRVRRGTGGADYARFRESIMVAA